MLEELLRGLVGAVAAIQVCRFLKTSQPRVQGGLLLKLEAETCTVLEKQRSRTKLKKINEERDKISSKTF